MKRMQATGPVQLLEGPRIMNHPILLVDNDANDAAFMQAAFKRAGVNYPIQVVVDGQEALDYFQGAGKFAGKDDARLPRLVLLGLKASEGMDFRVLEWLRAQPELKTTPVLVLSACSDARTIQYAYQLGANGYLRQPADLEELYLMAKAVKDYWLTHNHSVAERPVGTL